MEEGTPIDPKYQTNDGDKALRPKKLVDFTGRGIFGQNYGAKMFFRVRSTINIREKS